MAMNVIVEIDPINGEITYEVEGAVGTKCTDITNVLISGKKVLKEELKQSYFDTADSPDYVTNM